MAKFQTFDGLGDSKPIPLHQWRWNLAQGSRSQLSEQHVATVAQKNMDVTLFHKPFERVWYFSFLAWTLKMPATYCGLHIQHQ